jgi:hypothetical protein
VTQKSIGFTDIDLTLPKKRGKLSGNLVIDTTSTNFDMSGDLEFENISTKWTYAWKKGLSLPFNKLNGRLKNFRITNKDLKFDINGYSLIKNNQKLFLNGNFKIVFDSAFMSYSNFKININDSSIDLKNFNYNVSNDALNFAINALDVDFNDIKNFVPKIPNKIFGKIKGKISFINKKTNANLSISNAGYGNKKRVFSNINGNFTIKDNYFRIEKLPFKFYDQPATISAAATHKSYKDIVANLYVKEFIIPDRPKKKSDKPVKIDPKIKYDTPEINLPLFIKGRIEIEKLKFKDSVFNDVFVSYNLTKNRLNIPQISTRYFDTHFVGSGQTELLNKSTNININFKFNDLRVQKFAAYTKDKTPRFFGNAAGKLNFNFSLKKNRRLLDSIKGNAQFKIDQGKLVNTGIQNGLGIWLDPLKHKLKDLEFDTIYGNINVDGSKYNVNSFVFNSPNIRLAMNGFFTKGLKGDLKINLEFNKYFVQDLPKLATISILQKYKKGKWYVFPFSDKGEDITDSKNIKLLD